MATMTRSMLGASIAMVSLCAGLTMSAAAAPQNASLSFNPKAVDRSGSPRVGKASFYADRYFGKKMANGGLMNPHGDNAASMTLPLGTTARVKNLETGKSAVVTVQDRGPYVKGRIIDLSPATAKLIGLSTKQGLAKVEVTPLALPHTNAELKHAAKAGTAVTVAAMKNDELTLRSLGGE